VGTGRLEAFSDGVLAIILTIMVLELRLPHGAELSVLRPALPAFVSYVLSFVYIGIYWNNHHHMLHAAGRVSGGILWANLHLLFWLSLVPSVTGWMGDNHFAALPVALYGVVLLMAGIAYFLLARALAAHHGKDSKLAIAIGKDTKGKASVAVYVVAIPLSFLNPWIAFILYVVVALVWFIPDRRFERVLAE
jgi:uncharacterized membrane protein